MVGKVPLIRYLSTVMTFLLIRWYATTAKTRMKVASTTSFVNAKLSTISLTTQKMKLMTQNKRNGRLSSKLKISEDALKVT